MHVRDPVVSVTDEADTHGQPGHRTWLCHTCYLEGLAAYDAEHARERALALAVRAADEERAAREFYARHYEGQVVELRLKVYVPALGSDDAERLVRDILNDAQFDIRVTPLADNAGPLS